MRRPILASALLIAFSSSCGGGGGGFGGGAGVASSKSKSKSGSGGTDSGSSSSNDSGAPSADDHIDQPAQVAGAFLTVDCGRTNDKPPKIKSGEDAIGCAVVDRGTKKKYAGKASVTDVTFNFKDGSKLVPELADATSGSAWHVLTTLPSAKINELTLTTSHSNIEGKSYKIVNDKVRHYNPESLQQDPGSTDSIQTDPGVSNAITVIPVSTPPVTTGDAPAVSPPVVAPATPTLSILDLHTAPTKASDSTTYAGVGGTPPTGVDPNSQIPVGLAFDGSKSTAWNAGVKVVPDGSGTGPMNHNAPVWAAVKVSDSGVDVWEIDLTPTMSDHCDIVLAIYYKADGDYSNGTTGETKAIQKLVTDQHSDVPIAFKFETPFHAKWVRIETQDERCSYVAWEEIAIKVPET